jgi:hypothetical protein
MRSRLGIALAITLGVAAPAAAQGDARDWGLGVGYSFMHDSGSKLSFPVGFCGLVEKTVSETTSMRISADGDGCLYHSTLALGTRFQFGPVTGSLNGPRFSNTNVAGGGGATLFRVTGGATVHFNEGKPGGLRPFVGVQGGAIHGGGETGWGFAPGGGVEYQWTPKLNIRVGVEFGFFHVTEGWTKELTAGAGVVIPIGK